MSIESSQNQNEPERTPKEGRMYINQKDGEKVEILEVKKEESSVRVISEIKPNHRVAKQLPLNIFSELLYEGSTYKAYLFGELIKDDDLAK